MGCDCGKRMVSKAEQRDCDESAKLEAPDQVFTLMHRKGGFGIPKIFGSGIKIKRERTLE